MNIRSSDIALPNGGSIMSTSDTTASSGHRSFLAGGLLAFDLMWLVPLLLLVWVGSVAFGGVGLSEALQRTQGLAPDTFGAAFRLAGVIVAVFVVFEIRGMIASSAERFRPLRWLLTHPVIGLLLLAVPTMLLVRWDIKGTDIPDILTTTLLLLCWAFLWVVVPVALLSAGWKLTRRLWQWGRRSGFAAGALGTLGLLFGLCTPVVVSSVRKDDVAKDIDLASVEHGYARGFDAARDESPADGSRLMLKALSSVIDGPREIDNTRRRRPLRPSRPFGDCVTSLRASELWRLYRGLADAGASPFASPLALEAVSAVRLERAALETCTRHVGKDRGKLEREFASRMQLAQQSAASTTTLRRCYHGPSRFDTALCKLGEDEFRLLQLVVHGHDIETIGELQDAFEPEEVPEVERRTINGLREMLGLKVVH